jgi:hypothetical protein
VAAIGGEEPEGLEKRLEKMEKENWRMKNAKSGDWPRTANS